MEELKITTISELKKYTNGAIVELPPFAEGERFVARIKRPSVLKMAEQNKIPNELLATANTLFMNGSSVNTRDKDLLPRIMGFFESLMEQSFVEPTYSELKEAGIELTDEQMLFVFNYAQKGVKSLERFHTDEPG